MLADHGELAFCLQCTRRRRSSLLTLLAVAAAALPGGRVRPGLQHLSAFCKFRTADWPPRPPGTSASVTHPLPNTTPLPLNDQILPSCPKTTPNSPNIGQTKLPHLTNSQWLQFGSYKNMQALLIMHGIERNPGPQTVNHLTIAHLNINSITADNKIDELEQFITTNDIKILA